MEQDNFPLVVDEPRDIEVLGSAPMAAAVWGAVVNGIGVGLLFELGGWMLHKGDALAAVGPALIATTATIAALIVVYFVDSSRRVGERFTFWPDRFERSGPGGMWLVRYGEIATVQFVSRARVDIHTREGQPRPIKHMVFSFMQRLQEVCGPELARRLRQQEIESGRGLVLREPLSFPMKGLVWLLRLLVLGSLVWYCVALYVEREGQGALYATTPALIAAAAGGILMLLVARLGTRRTVLSREGIRQPGTSISWGDVERLSSDMDGVEVRARTKGVRPCRITWHATNVMSLPYIVAEMTEGVRVDTSEWASPWQLMGADPVSLAPPDFD